MIVNHNGVDRQATLEEETRINLASNMDAAAERHRPLTPSEVIDLSLRSTIQTVNVDDATAHRMMEYYPEWAKDTHYMKGNRVRYGEDLFRCRQEHDSQEIFPPSINTASLWGICEEDYVGDMYDPVPYKGNNALERGKYYTEEDVLYRCTRSTGQEVYQSLKDLVGNFVEVVNDGNIR